MNKIALATINIKNKSNNREKIRNRIAIIRMSKLNVTAAGKVFFAVK